MRAGDLEPTDAHGLVDVDVYAPKKPETTFPVFGYRQAPSGLATKRQLRALGLRPGGQEPVAEVETRGPRNGLLYEIAKALPVRPMTLAKEAALDKAMAARQTCPKCGRRFFHCLPKRFGVCLECHDGTPAHPSSYITLQAAPPGPPLSHNRKDFTVDFNYFSRPSRELQLTDHTGELSLQGEALAADAAAFLAGQSTTPAPAPARAPRQNVSVSVEAVERLLVEHPRFREDAEQIGCVPAGATVLLLEQAIALLRSKGWLRGAYQRDNGYCLQGALEAATKAVGAGWEVGRAAELAVRLTLAAHTPEQMTSVIVWNDDLRRTGDQVLGLLASSIVIAWHYGASA